MAFGTNTDHDHNSSPSETRSIDSEHHARRGSNVVIHEMADDFVNPYAQQRNHRVSNPPPVIPEEGGVSQNMMRHYSDPLPVQPQANKPRIVKALSNMRPPCFDVANNNNKNNTDHETWKCSVCTYQNQCAVDVCLMCGLPKSHKQNGANDAAAAMALSYDMMDEEDDMYGDPAMYAMDDFLPQDVGDFGGGSGKKWQCGACTFKNHEWNDRCEICSALQQPTDEVIGANPVVAMKKKQNGVIGGGTAGWTCRVCTLLNQGANARCKVCNTIRNNSDHDAVDDVDSSSSSFNEYGSFMANPMIEYDNDWDRMLNRHMGVSGNPYNINLHFDYGELKQGDDSDKKNKDSTVEEFSRSASDIACYNDWPSGVFCTLRSVAKKLLKDDVRYRTLDTTNPKVMERLIGFEGVLDFLMLLGFESDAMGMKLICELKPTRNVINNAISVLNSYQQRFRMTAGGDMADDTNESDEEEHKTQGGFPSQLNDKSLKKKEKHEIQLDQIVLWSTHENMQDNDTMETLLMTHKLFTDSLTLLKQLRKRFFMVSGANVVVEAGVKKRIQLKVIKALRDWMKHYWPEDFRDNEPVQQEIRSWLHELSEYGSGVSWITKLTAAVHKEYCRLNEMDWDAILDAKLDIFSEYKDVEIKDIDLNKCSSEEIADQITLMDYSMFCAIEARECVHQRWKESSNKRCAPNILSLIQQFNKLSIFIQIRISEERSLRRRVTAIKRIVKMGTHFKLRRNYNSLCAVFSALNSAAIHRLKLAWARVPPKTRRAFQEWSVIFCRDRNHRNLRQLLRKAGGNPCIPHIGVFLQDLVFIDEGNKDELAYEAFNGNTMLNFNKCVRIADRIKNLQLFQHHKYNKIDANKQIQKILLIEFEKLKDTTEDQIWDMSTQVKKQDQKEAKQLGGGAVRYFNPLSNKQNQMKNVIPENVIPDQDKKMDNLKNEAVAAVAAGGGGAGDAAAAAAAII
eukprot:147504_1